MCAEAILFWFQTHICIRFLFLSLYTFTVPPAHYVPQQNPLRGMQEQFP